MPMYEYRCTGCGHQFEIRQKFSDAPETKCPQCGGLVEKLISQAAFSLKGGGWYDSGYCPKTNSSKPSSCSGGG